MVSAHPNRSARPQITAELMAETGRDDAILTRLVHDFYRLVRGDPLLGPVFAARITDWQPHLARMVAFWSSVALMTGRYHGAPIPATCHCRSGMRISAAGWSCFAPPRTRSAHPPGPRM